jgi:hypothetical protein
MTCHWIWLSLLIIYQQLPLSVASETSAMPAVAEPRGALILTMAGSGAPSYLQASCLSIASSASRFDMLIFHEDNPIIMTMKCADNVQKINVHQHGLARLITEAVCEASSVTAQTGTTEDFILYK